MPLSPHACSVPLSGIQPSNPFAPVSPTWRPCYVVSMAVFSPTRSVCPALALARLCLSLLDQEGDQPPSSWLCHSILPKLGASSFLSTFGNIFGGIPNHIPQSDVVPSLTGFQPQPAASLVSAKERQRERVTCGSFVVFPLTTVNLRSQAQPLPAQTLAWSDLPMAGLC